VDHQIDAWLKEKN